MSVLPVEESRAQRHQRLQTRFRDRGGIFVPPEKNTLIDILLARSVTGESPSKRTSTRKKQGSSPIREKGKSNVLDNHGGLDTVALDNAPLDDEMDQVGGKWCQKSSKRPRGKAAQEDGVGALRDGKHVTGPFGPDDIDDTAEAAAKGTCSGKTKEKAMIIPVKESRPTVKSQSKPAKDKQANQASATDGRGPPTKPTKVEKKRTRTADFEDEDKASSNYTPASRKRVKAAPIKSAATTRRKKKADQVTQLDHPNNSSAVVIAVKANIVQNSVDPKKKYFRKIRTVIQDDERPSTPKPGSRPKAQTPKRSFYVDESDGDSEATQVDRPTCEGSGVKAQSNRRTQPPDDVDGQDATSKSKNPVRSKKLSEPVPDSDGEDVAQVSSKLSTNVKMHTGRSSGKVIVKAPARCSSKRPRVAADGEKPKSDFEESVVPPHAQKRTKAIAPAASDDETLVASARSRSGAITPPCVEKVDPPRISKTSSKYPEYAGILKGKPAPRKKGKEVHKCHQVSQVKTGKGPPQEVLDRIKARPPSSFPPADSDTDPIDFLS